MEVAILGGRCDEAVCGGNGFWDDNARGSEDHHDHHHKHMLVVEENSVLKS